MKALDIRCPVCKAEPQVPCTNTVFLGASHFRRLAKASKRPNLKVVK